MELFFMLYAMVSAMGLIASVRRLPKIPQQKGH
jgi:hypothetical protein